MTPADLQRALSFIEALDHAETPAATTATVIRLLSLFDMEFYAFLETNPGPVDSIFCSELPPGVLTLYVEREYNRVDPALRHSRVSNRPFMWRDAPYDPATETAASLFVKQVQAFRLADGLVIPVRLARHSGLVWFGGYQPRLEHGSLHILHLLAIYSFERLRELQDAETTDSVLSAREREVLGWMAVGKTAWEIGEILSITKRTVDFHTQTILRKYGAINRTHAVALGIRRGEVRL